MTDPLIANSQRRSSSTTFRPSPVAGKRSAGCRCPDKTLFALVLDGLPVGVIWAVLVLIEVPEGPPALVAVLVGLAEAAPIVGCVVFVRTGTGVFIDVGAVPVAAGSAVFVGLG
jgi:hypothetical protein